MNTKRISAGCRTFALPLVAILLNLALETTLLAKSKTNDVTPTSQDFWVRLAFVGSAQIKEIKGHAECLKDDGVWSPLSGKQALSIGAKIRTLQNSEIVLQMD